MTDILLTGVRLAAPAGPTVPVDVLITDGRVAAVGEDLVAVATGPASRAERVALDGRFLLPGMWDAHTHMTQWALARQRLDVAGARSAADAARLVVDRLRDSPVPEGALLVGFGFRDGLWPDVPTSAVLDDALAAAGLPPVPVVLVAGDLHCAWLSSAALARFGVGPHPDGVLREGEWFAINPRLGDAPAHVLDGWVDEAARAAAARGVVGVVDFEQADNLPAWHRRVGAGTDVLRVEAAVWPDHLDRAVAQELASGDVLLGTGGLVRMGPLKVISDGSLNTRTAYCHDPYPGLEGTPGAYGHLAIGPDELVPLMRHARRHGIDSAIHAIGDHANGLALDAFAASGARGSIEHAQLLAPDDVARFAALGVTASVQPEHAMDDRDVADRHWAGRTGRAFPLADLARAGARLVLGSDAPVAPLDPWVAIAAAVTRGRDGRDPWHPEQRIDLALAVEASTGGRTGDGRSEVAVGDPADLVVLDADPWACDGDALRTMPVAGTLLGGRWTHRAF